MKFRTGCDPQAHIFGAAGVVKRVGNCVSRVTTGDTVLCITDSLGTYLYLDQAFCTKVDLKPEDKLEVCNIIYLKI